MRPERLFLPFLFILTVALTSGCSLIYDYNDCPTESVGAFLVDSDWLYAPDADPEGMAYVFFPAEGEEWRFDFPGRTGGEVKLPDGEYSVMAFNDDTSGVLFGRKGDYDEFAFYCRKGGLYDGLGGTIDRPLGPDVTGQGESVEICPDMLWCGSCSSCDLRPDGVDVTRTAGASTDHSDKRLLVMYPRRIVAEYSFIVGDVSNLGGVAHVCASMSGMASYLRPSDMFRGSAVTLPVKAVADGKSTISGNFLTYGLPSEGDAPNILSLYIWLADGQKLCYTFDVTGLARGASDPLHVAIRISGLDLPESGPPTGGGFDVSVEGWITTVINIKS